MKNTNKAAIIILDGWGHGVHPKADALRLAKTPFIDSLYRNYPNSELVTFGAEVGLPDGQMGNSEVGHLNIGAGRIVYQDLAKINKEIREGKLEQNPTLVKAIEKAKSTNVAFHLIGLLSDGGVHSHIEHLKALCDICDRNDLNNVFLHTFMDGRDTAPTGGQKYLQDISTHIESSKIEIATIVGRYYAMDRDNRWERIKLAYDAMVKGVGSKVDDIDLAMKESYKSGITDEFLMPMITSDIKDSRIKDGDIVLFYNFRTDRPRQITKALTQEDFPEHDMRKLNIDMLTMTKYDETFKGLQVMYDKDDIKNTIGEVISKQGLSQLRIAETEKYPHVTFFLSGGREVPFEKEKRIVVPSPKVATYDLQPEMSAKEITESIIENIEKEQPDFICLNYANTDMVGHTGDFEACMKAAETVDKYVNMLVQVLIKNDYHSLIIADHGNSDLMINPDGSPHTAHTTNLVPCFLVSNKTEGVHLKNGKLADIAPTILALMNINKPEEMTGSNLLE